MSAGPAASLAHGRTEGLLRQNRVESGLPRKNPLLPGQRRPWQLITIYFQMRRVRGNPDNQDNDKHCAKSDVEAHSNDQAIAQRVSKKFYSTKQAG
jgi:hypothetical protein